MFNADDFTVADKIPVSGRNMNKQTVHHVGSDMSHPMNNDQAKITLVVLPVIQARHGKDL